MSSYALKAAVASLIIAAAMSTAPVTASAQDAIMLESLGAVRMASPAEIQQMNAAAPIDSAPTQSDTARPEHPAITR